MTLPLFPGYTDVSSIGSGGFAEVFSARHDALGRRVAIKLFRVALDDPGAARRFEDECAALIRLDGEDEVLRVHDAQMLPDRRPYLVSELCSRSLPELAGQRGGALPADEVVAIGRRMARALAAAHFARVLHGDVTPQNVLFRPGGDAVLADFGLAVIRDHRGNTAAGFTPAHAAPETVRADGAFSPRTDVYGLGSTLYTALTGQAPFPLRVGENDAARALRILHEQAPRAAQAPPWLADLLAAMLAKDAEARPTAAEVVAALGTGGSVAAAAERSVAMGPAFAPPPGVAPAGSSEQHTRGRAAAPSADPGSSDELGRTRLRAGGRPRADSPTGDRRRIPRVALFAAVALVLVATVAGVIGVLAVGGTGSGSISEPAPAAAAPAAGPAVIDLAAPVDDGTTVTLSWTADRGLDYGVIVAAEGAQPTTQLADRATTITLPVEPGLRYCFQVQGADGVSGVFESNVQSLRGAVCRF